MSGCLDGQLALVTGGGRGIGRAIALALAGEGAALELVARSKEQLERTAALAREAGAPSARSHVIDVSNGAALDALASALLDAHGAVDVLVNNAGAFSFDNALDGDPDAWERMMAINALAPMRLTRRLAPAMAARERGCIVNIGSVAAIEAMKVPGAYAASKHALRGWSLSCYERLRESGVKVVLINPGYVETDMTRAIPSARRDRMITTSDVAAAAMLAITTSPMCCPQEITLRLTKPA